MAKEITFETTARDKIKKEVNQVVHKKFPYGNIVMNGSALVIYGEK